MDLMSGVWRRTVVDIYIQRTNIALASLVVAHYVWDPLTATLTGIDLLILRRTSPCWTLCVWESLSERSVERCCSGPFAS